MALRIFLLVLPVCLFGCVQHTLTPGEAAQIRYTSKNIQTEDRQERREYLQDRKEFELSNEGYGNNIYIER